MSVYGLNTAQFGTHYLIAQEMGSGNNILDVGCNKGYLKILAKNNNFYGIDLRSDDLSQAKRQGYKKVFKLDLNNYKSFKSKEKYEVIVFADILEHLIFPDKVLKFFVDHYLDSGGKIIISLPNVAHITVRLSLMRGRFVYTQSGILDRTHLHLYTVQTAGELITSSGLKIVKSMFSSNRFGRFIQHFPFSGTLLGFNLIFVCRKKS